MELLVTWDNMALKWCHCNDGFHRLPSHKITILVKKTIGGFIEIYLFNVTKKSNDIEMPREISRHMWNISHIWHIIFHRLNTVYTLYTNGDIMLQRQCANTSKSADVYISTKPLSESMVTNYELHSYPIKASMKF